MSYVEGVIHAPDFKVLPMLSFWPVQVFTANHVTEYTFMVECMVQSQYCGIISIIFYIISLQYIIPLSFNAEYTVQLMDHYTINSSMLVFTKYNDKE